MLVGVIKLRSWLRELAMRMCMDRDLFRDLAPERCWRFRKTRPDEHQRVDRQTGWAVSNRLSEGGLLCTQELIIVHNRPNHAAQVGLRNLRVLDELPRLGMAMADGDGDGSFGIAALQEAISMGEKLSSEALEARGAF